MEFFAIFLSVIIISAISLIGLFTVSVSAARIRSFLLYMVSFAAGAMMGDVFLHLLPEHVHEHGWNPSLSFSVLAGIMTMFFVEKVIQWHHCHHSHEESEHHVHPVAKMNLIGDGVHNFIDGMVIAASYAVSIPVGIATTIAVALHEIPQEIGDFGVLLHAGYTKKRALLFNFLSALLALLGAALAFFLVNSIDGLLTIIVPFAAGVFIYVAGSDLIPELHKQTAIKVSLIQFLFFAAGIAIMLGLLETHTHEEHGHDEETHIEQHQEEDDHHHEDEDMHLSIQTNQTVPGNFAAAPLI